MSEAIMQIQNPTLNQVSLEGDVVGLERLIREDPLVLDKVSASETPLHIAAMRGHFAFARAILNHKPELADESDSFLRLPLHWASEKGYSDIVKELLQKSSPDHKACFARDADRRIPLHLAAIKGRDDAIGELVRTCPVSIREKVENGGTILHLCVKFNRIQALKLLMDTAEGHGLVNDSDDHGNTILHLAVIFKQVEITKYLVSESLNIDANASNVNGFAALDVAEHSPMDSKALEIKNILLEAGFQKNTKHAKNPLSVPSTTTSTQRGCKTWWKTYTENVGRRIEEARGNILVAATVTASMAYQAGIQPPQSNTHDQNSSVKQFWYTNTLSLYFSLVIIIIMLGGIPFRNKFADFVLVIAMGAIVILIILAYIYAMKVTVPDLVWEDYEWVLKLATLAILMVPLMLCVIILVYICTFFWFLVSKILKSVKT